MIELEQDLDGCEMILPFFVKHIQRAFWEVFEGGNRRVTEGQGRG